MASDDAQISKKRRRDYNFEEDVWSNAIWQLKVQSSHFLFVCFHFEPEVDLTIQNKIRSRFFELMTQEFQITISGLPIYLKWNNTKMNSPVYHIRVAYAKQFVQTATNTLLSKVKKVIDDEILSEFDWKISHLLVENIEQNINCDLEQTAIKFLGQ